MKRASRALFAASNLLSTSKNPIKLLPPFSKPFSSPTKPGIKDPKTPQTPNKRDSLIFEQFKLRKLKGTENADPQSQRPTPTSTRTSTGFEKAGKRSEVVLEGENYGPAKVVSSFHELGLREEVIEGLKEMGISAPSEIQCVGIPAVLDGTSVVLCSESGAGRTLAYLLPLLQAFRVATFIIDNARLKSSKKNDHDKSKDSEDVSNAPIGVLIGTPSEILQHIEEGNVVCDDIKCLVLDEADAMLNRGFHSEIQKILNPLKGHGRLQTILITSTTAQMLGKEVSPVME